MRYTTDFDWLLTQGIVLLGLLFLVLGILRLFLPVQRLEPQCPACRYPLKGLPLGRDSCPECGAILTQREWKFTATWKAWPLPVRPVTLTACGILLLLVIALASGVEITRRTQSIRYMAYGPLNGIMLECVTQAVWTDTLVAVGSYRRWEIVLWRSLDSEPTLIGVANATSYPSEPSDWVSNASAFHEQHPLFVSPWPVEQGMLEQRVYQALEPLYGSKSRVGTQTEDQWILEELQRLWKGKPYTSNRQDHITRLAVAHLPAHWRESKPISALILIALAAGIVLLARRVDRTTLLRHERTMNETSPINR